MGERRPKSGTGGTNEGPHTGPNDPTGRGEYDPATGLWDYYETAEGAGLTWEAILDHWGLIVADFADYYTIRLHRDPVTWAEFKAYVAGLLAVESRLWRATRPETDQPPEG